MKTTQKEVIKNILKNDGYVDNFLVMDEHISIRLGAIIYTLKQEGWIFDEQKSGFIPNTKNWRYYLKRGVRQPFQPEYEYREQADGTRKQLRIDYSHV